MEDAGLIYKKYLCKNCFLPTDFNTLTEWQFLGGGRESVGE
jgi:hypothetical protein